MGVRGYRGFARLRNGGMWGRHRYTALRNEDNAVITLYPRYASIVMDISTNPGLISAIIEYRILLWR